MLRNQITSFVTFPVRQLILKQNEYKKTLTHTFKTFTGVGRAKEMLMERVQKEMISDTAGNRLSICQVSWDSDDAMMLYNEIGAVSRYLTFHYVDELLDFLMSNQSKAVNSVVLHAQGSW